VACIADRAVARDANTHISDQASALRQGTAVPHCPQNLAPACNGPLHFPHADNSSDVPHRLQNCACVEAGA
jgi:hypothetical protein